MRKFLPFEEALAAARSLGLASKTEWEMWCKEEMRPPNMPAHPEGTYKDSRWHGWGHWLGTGSTEGDTKKPFLPFEEGLGVARSLGLAGQVEWVALCKEGRRPAGVPSTPQRTYKDGGWRGWGHWLGTGNTRPGTKRFLPFDEALAAARSLGLASQKEWKEWSKEGARPPAVPSAPGRTYKDGGWQGWGHWLGTGTQSSSAKQFLPFGEGLAAARSLGLASKTEWELWSKQGMRPPGVPSVPDRVYKDSGWQGWGHWLGTGNIINGIEQFLPFHEALAVARSLGLASQKKWKAWSKEGAPPPNVPSAPGRTYKDGGWQGWVHWLGSGSIKKASKSAPFSEAHAFARSLNLANTREWKAWCKEGARPPNVPADPSKTYKDGGWQGWGHWLGTGNQPTIAKKAQFLPFDECLRVARHLRLVSKREWQLWCRSGARPANVPAYPDEAYVHGGWNGWKHWLCHAKLGVAVVPTAQKRAAPCRTRESSSKRQRR